MTDLRDFGERCLSENHRYIIQRFIEAASIALEARDTFGIDVEPVQMFAAMEPLRHALEATRKELKWP